MSEAAEFGRYAPYIFAAYSVSAAVIAALIIARSRRLNNALKKKSGGDELTNSSTK